MPVEVRGQLFTLVLACHLFEAGSSCYSAWVAPVCSPHPSSHLSADVNHHFQLSRWPLGTMLVQQSLSPAECAVSLDLDVW